MLKFVDGDLVRMALNGEFDVIVQGCNCHCRMASGIAKQIKQVFPEAWMVDQNTIPGDRNKLGSYTNGVTKINGKTLYVVNAYTQYNYGTDSMKADYDAIRQCMKKVASNFHNLKIGLPKIGAGLAGGDWNVIVEILEEELADIDATVVNYKP